MTESSREIPPPGAPPPPPEDPQDAGQGNDLANPDMSRRHFLGWVGKVIGGAAAIGASVGVGKAIADIIAPPPEKIDLPTPQPAQTELPKSPEILTLGIEFGFNTHLDNEAQNMTLDLFKKCVEDLSGRGQQWIRLNLQGYNASSPDIMSDFDQGLDYAKQKGLKIAFVVTDPPDPNDPASISDFYSGLAERFKGKVNIWQIFNEPNTHDFRDYGKRPQLTDEYLEGLSKAVAAASSGIKKVDPDAKTTISLSAPQAVDVASEGLKLFGSVIESIDIATLDLYPEANEELIAKYPGYVASLHGALGKDIMIGEIGWPTFENGFTPQDQARYMGKVMSAFQGGSVKPIAVLFYEWADEQGVGENAFGANKADGTPKDAGSYEKLIHTMTPQKNS